MQGKRGGATRLRHNAINNKGDDKHDLHGYRELDLKPLAHVHGAANSCCVLGAGVNSGPSAKTQQWQASIRCITQLSYTDSSVQTHALVHVLERRPAGKRSGTRAAKVKRFRRVGVTQVQVTGSARIVHAAAVRACKENQNKRFMKHALPDF